MSESKENISRALTELYEIRKESWEIQRSHKDHYGRVWILARDINIGSHRLIAELDAAKRWSTKRGESLNALRDLMGDLSRMDAASLCKAGETKQGD